MEDALVVAAVALALLVALGVFSVQRIAKQRDRAQAAEAKTGLALTRADAALTQALQGSAALAAIDLAQPEAEVLATAAPDASSDPVLRGLLAGLPVDSNHPARVSLPGSGCPLGALSLDGKALYCWQNDQLVATATATSAVLWKVPLAQVTQVRAVEGQLAVALHTGGGRGVVTLDAATGAQVATMDLVAPMQLHGGRRMLVATNPGWLVRVAGADHPAAERPHPCPNDQQLLAVAVGRADDALVGICEATVMLAEPGTLAWQPLALANAPTVKLSATAAALQSREGWLILGTTRGQLAAIDLRRRRWVREITTAGGMIRDLQFAPAAAQVLVQPERGGVLLWAPQSLAGPRRLPWPHSRIAGFSENGQVVTVADTAHLWQPQPERAAVIDLVGAVGLTSASSYGAWVAGSGGDGSVVVADTKTGDERLRVQAMAGVAKRVSFSADGQWLAVSSMARPYLRLFDTGTWQAHADAGLEVMIRRAEFAKGRLLVATPVAKGGPMLLPVGVGGLVGPALLVAPVGFSDAAVSLGGQHAVWMAEVGGVVLQAALDDRPKLVEALRAPGAVAVDVSSDGELLALATADEVLLRRGSGQELVHLGKVPCRLMDVTLDASAEWVAAPCSQGQIYVWSTATRALRAELRGHTGHTVHVAFDQLGDLLSAGWDGTVRRWHGPTLREPQLPTAAAAQLRWQLTLPQALARPR